MSEYLFLTGNRHLPDEARDIAERHGCVLVNYTDPGTGEKRSWFSGPNRGYPFDRWLSVAVRVDLVQEGILKP